MVAGDYSPATTRQDLRLFGSRARGAAQSHSDYDMLVIVDRRSPDLRDAILEIEVDLIDRYEALVTSIVRTEDEWKQRQGTPLALNSPSLQRFGAERQRMMRRVLDDGSLRFPSGKPGYSVFWTLARKRTSSNNFRFAANKSAKKATKIV